KSTGGQKLRSGTGGVGRDSQCLTRRRIASGGFGVRNRRYTPSQADESAQAEEALPRQGGPRSSNGRGHAGATTRPLKRDDEPVISALFRHAVDVGEHLLTEMREDNALGPDFSLVRDEVGIVEVEPDRLVEEAALRDEEIGAVGQSPHVLPSVALAPVSQY